MTEPISFLESRERSVLNPRSNFDPNVIRKFNFSNDSTKTSTRETMKVYLRLKPLTTDSIDKDQNFVIKDDKSIFTYCLPNKRVYKEKRQVSNYCFTRVFGPEADQSDIFLEAVSNMCIKFIFGKSCLLFSYGSTSSGKTYTIKGTGSNPGIIPRTLVMLFKSIEGKLDCSSEFYPERVQTITLLSPEAQAQLAETKSRILATFDLKPTKAYKGTKLTSSINDSLGDFTYDEMEEGVSSEIPSVEFNEDVLSSVWVSFIEVYNENVYDLLDSSVNRKSLQLAYDSDKMIYVKGLQYVNVRSGSEAFKVFLYGKNNLHISSTVLNKCSSRSHSIFTIKVVNRHPDGSVSVSSFSICDLAGTERQKKVQSKGGRLKECQNINTSHLVLNRCFKIIRENQKKKDKHLVPFRDSKLTQLFQRALTSHEDMIMIVNINQSTELLEETLQVLKSSAIAHEIEVQPLRPKHYSRRKSRFLTSYATRCFSIQWEQEGTNEALLEKSSEQHLSFVSNKENQTIRDLMARIESLQSDLENEKEQKIISERKLRAELCTGFKEIIAEMETEHKEKLVEASTLCYSCNEEYLKGTGKRRKVDHDTKWEDKSGDCDSILLELKEDYVKRVAELEQELSETQARIMELTDSNQQLRKKNANLNCQLSVYQNEQSIGMLNFEKLIKDLKDDKVTDVIEDLQKKMEDAKNKNKELEDLLELGHEEIEGLLKNLYKLECKLEEKNTLLDKKDVEIENLKTERFELEAIIALKDDIINQQKEEKENTSPEDLNESFVSLKLEEEKTKPLLNQTSKSITFTNFFNAFSDKKTCNKKRIEEQGHFESLQSEVIAESKVELEESEKSLLLGMSTIINELRAKNQLLVKEWNDAKCDFAIWIEEKMKEMEAIAILKDKELANSELVLRDLIDQVNQLQKDQMLSNKINADLKSELEVKTEEVQRLEFDQKTFIKAEYFDKLKKFESETELKEKLIMESTEEKRNLEHYIEQCQKELESFKANQEAICAKYEKQLKESQEKLEAEKQKQRVLNEENKNLRLKVETLNSNIAWLETEHKTDQNLKSSKTDASQSSMNSDEEEDDEDVNEKFDDDDDDDIFAVPKPKTSVKKKKNKKKVEDELPSYSFRSKTKSEEKVNSLSLRTRRVGRKLFSHDSGEDELNDETKSVEQVQSSPSTYVKRVLRSRKN